MGTGKGKRYNSMKKRENRLDEMQEQKMIHIEHNGFWIGYIGLAIAVLASYMARVCCGWICYGDWYLYMHPALHVTFGRGI